MEDLSDKKIIQSWHINAAPWVAAVRQQQIKSRQLITNQAIVDAISTLPGNSLLDIGCGEGWLSNQMSLLGFKPTGIDVVPELIKEAQCSAQGDFKVLAYEDISKDEFTTGFDIAVCNFSLLGKESVENIFKQLPFLLNRGGHLIIQTPHPYESCGTHDYKNGWRVGSWEGFSDDFSDPAPWYFRTISSWITLFIENGFTIDLLKEPTIVNSKKAASLIIAGYLPGK